MHLTIWIRSYSFFFYNPKNFQKRFDSLITMGKEKRIMAERKAGNKIYYILYIYIYKMGAAVRAVPLTYLSASSSIVNMMGGNPVRFSGKVF